MTGNRAGVRRAGSLTAAAFTLSAGVAFAQEDDADFSTGLSFLPEDEYLEIEEAPRYRQHLPQSVDLTRYYPRVGQQGNQGSCVSWAVGYAARGYLEGRARGASRPGPAALASPEFLHTCRGERSTAASARSVARSARATSSLRPSSC